jgi:asparagine synthase (glutamine-hydrolysing)
MCGILAVFEAPEEQNEKIKEAAKFLKRRGPDKSNLVISGNNNIFVFHRLSINDTSEAGMQPFIRDNVLVMCNGEIYNYKELISEYDIKVDSHSDCEVLIPLYKKLGFEGMIKKLYGVFSIILVDGYDVYIARDRFGIRPLFFGITSNDKLAFASVPNVLLPFTKCVSHINPGLIAHYNYRNAPILWAIDMDTLELSKNRVYHSLEKIKDTLTKAVERRLVSDRPIGCLLSGGLDSSIITSILCRLVGPQNVRTYSIGMRGSTDLEYARIVADSLGTVHKEILFTPEEGFEAIPEVIKILGTYDITTIRASVGMYLVSKYISENSDDKVIFSGEGSDEVLEGYLYFHKAPSEQDGEEESLRLMRNLHLYDVLRADRCISSNGLEPRVPFLDREFVDLALSMYAKEKCPRKGYEKYILRLAFEGYLPEKVLWRRKEAFSDGVSSMQKPWYSEIADRVEKIIPDYLFNSKFPSKEAMYYKMIFDNLFPNYALKVDYWLPKWTNLKDPSARLITI